MLQRDAVAHEDRRITTRQLGIIISINKGRVSHIIQDLGYSNVCAEWVQQNPGVGQKAERKAIFSELLRERPSYLGLL
jgi:hypothetical protein